MFLRMIHSARKKMQYHHLEEKRASPRFETPLYIQEGDGGYVQRYGKLSIAGFYFETTSIPCIGQTIKARMALVGLGKEIEAVGSVVHLFPGRSHVGVAVRFNEIPFETERMIARWLDMLAQAYQIAATA